MIKLKLLEKDLDLLKKSVPKTEIKDVDAIVTANLENSEIYRVRKNFVTAKYIRWKDFLNRKSCNFVKTRENSSYKNGLIFYNKFGHKHLLKGEEEKGNKIIPVEGIGESFAQIFQKYYGEDVKRKTRRDNRLIVYSV
ncbi:MAG: hypothetical protein JW700_00075 [Candidatus Aenigmarchaeota archaeon]|nr:hypothetical protein [Candidatus Aenigmarchaeota archaeon]